MRECPPGHMPQQSGLAQPGLAADDQRGTLPGSHLLAEAVQLSKLVLPAVELHRFARHPVSIVGDPPDEAGQRGAAHAPGGGPPVRVWKPPARPKDFDHRAASPTPAEPPSPTAASCSGSRPAASWSVHWLPLRVSTRSAGNVAITSRADTATPDRSSRAR